MNNKSGDFRGRQYDCSRKVLGILTRSHARDEIEIIANESRAREERLPLEPARIGERILACICMTTMGRPLSLSR